MPPRMDSGDVRAALRLRYPEGEYALLWEVGQGTGHHGKGWADAIAMSLWPSRGLELSGFEIKVSKSDWKRELQRPAKAEEFVALCDRWWIAAPLGIVKREELPPTWGLIECLGNGKTKITVPAPLLEGRGNTFSRKFVAALLRRASEADAGMVKALADKTIQEQRERDEQRVEREIERRSQSASELLKKADAIKAATGIDLRGWQPMADVAGAIRFALQADLDKKYGGLTSLVGTLRSQADRIEAALAAVLPKPTTNSDCAEAA